MIWARQVGIYELLVWKSSLFITCRFSRVKTRNIILTLLIFTSNQRKIKFGYVWHRIKECKLTLNFCMGLSYVKDSNKLSFPNNCIHLLPMNIFFQHYKVCGIFSWTGTHPLWCSILMENHDPLRIYKLLLVIFKDYDAPLQYVDKLCNSHWSSSLP